MAKRPEWCSHHNNWPRWRSFDAICILRGSSNSGSAGPVTHYDRDNIRFTAGFLQLHVEGTTQARICRKYSTGTGSEQNTLSESLIQSCAWLVDSLHKTNLHLRIIDSCQKEKVWARKKFELNKRRIHEDGRKNPISRKVANQVTSLLFESRREHEGTRIGLRESANNV